MPTPSAGPQHEIELFIRGQSAASSDAVSVVRQVCDARLPGGYQLRVVDVHQQPQAGDDAGIVATPTLVRRLPLPVLQTVGRLTEARVLIGLGLGA